TYELGPDEFSLYSGIISKKRMHVPYQRVQAVNQQAGLFQRLVGVCNVKIDTAGGAANDGVNLQYLRTSDAEALRSELFRRKKALMAGGTIAPDGTAMVGGVPYLSAWAVADAGLYPQGVPRAPFGYVTDAAATSAMPDGLACDAASATPLVASSAGSAGSETNVLDVADEVLQDVRGVFGGAEVDTGRVRFETGLSNKELLLAGASGAGEGLGLLAVGIVAAVGSVAQIFEGVIEKLAENWFASTVGTSDFSAFVNNAAAGSFIGAAAFQVILWALLAAAALWVLSALGTVVRYGGFRLRRREDRVEVEFGLLSRSFHGVDVDRIQSVVVKQSFIRRLMGYCELSVLKIDSAAESDASGSGAQQQLSKGVVVHPFVKMSRVHEILQGVLPEFADMPAETFRPAPAARRRAVVRTAVIRSAGFWFAVLVALCQIAMEAAVAFVPMDAESAVLISVFRQLMFAYYVVFALVFVVNVVDALLWYRRSGLGYDRAFMSMTNGGLSTTVTYTPRKKIQFAYLRTNPFQRMARVASVNVRTAAGIGGTTETLWDLSEEDAAAWLEWVRPRGKGAR
ncbi:MAG: PH domain-containing protein, partial [Alistipes finegoldii]|nr:PH domain-containing protein [Alistipes finegoldii]